ncbi:hypothetical protein THAOC_09935 [Thalassiosira oceanica]|uniref:Uncharacterized protein n=1 Tax=Thalassiosira oceanica TaxID=159749 RepID=K0T6B0_THAOC|nr:hypothetical protein THAOC_09935 [Thalassiosira oceanica]|eukprot:EJK68851.1 hypothetical protein THAOC_09935 [Thalassiosira oceanica]
MRSAFVDAIEAYEKEIVRPPRLDQVADAVDIMLKVASSVPNAVNGRPDWPLLRYRYCSNRPFCTREAA